MTDFTIGFRLLPLPVMVMIIPAPAASFRMAAFPCIRDVELAGLLGRRIQFRAGGISAVFCTSRSPNAQTANARA